ncbi:glycosyltransferase family 4 protein [Lysobacter korlensis]|uniref:Glycosyltransferase family 4 protein n=1 Tax=Lysobacter korlensis TaxID=553636 RepID=A0ABV6RWP9_9GAMM
MKRPRRVYVNEAFRPQRVSGQQRYATEISDRLPAGFVRLRPEGFWARSKLHTWLWVQTVLPLRSRRGVLISMTARAPLWHPRHVLVVHDLFVIEHPEWFSRTYQLTHAPLQRLQMSTAKAIVTVSEPVAAQVRKQWPNAHVRVAPNAPSPVFSEAGPKDPHALAVRGLTPGRYLVTVGSLEPRKNLSRLAAAYAELSEAQRAALPLVVVGGSADIYRDAAVAWPAEVQLAGYVSDDELRALYGGAAAVVFVSLAEGFGLPLVEASAAGTPRLIVSDLEVFRWICQDAATYVDPTSTASVAAAIAEVADGLPPGTGRIDPNRFSWEASAATIAATATIGSGRSTPPARTAIEAHPAAEDTRKNG